MSLLPVPSPGSLQQRIADMEAALTRAAAHLPNLPATEVLIIRSVALLAREISALFEDELRPHGLNETDFRTLMILFSQPNHTAHPSELCAHVGQSPANMTRVTDGLFERGLISRVASDEDRRRTILCITATGEALVHQLLPGTHARLREIFGDMPAAERVELLAQLRGILGRVDRCAERSAALRVPSSSANPPEDPL
jgi:MarR family transcriptional regulator, negative regulator of the multidrug operon emrRAB